MFVVADLAEYVPGEEEEALLHQLEANDHQWISEEGLRYIAGYVAYRFKNKYPNLGCPTRKLPEINNIRSEYLVLLSRGGLMYPSDEFLNVAKAMENIFINFHGPEALSKEKKIFQSVADKIISNANFDVPYDALLCLVRTRTYIRLRIINIKIRNLNKVSNKKNKNALKKFF